MSSRLIDLTNDLKELQLTVNSFFKELESDDINTVKAKHYSVKASYDTYYPSKVEGYLEQIIAKTAELEALKQNKDALIKNYGSALHLLQTSNFKHASVKDSVFKHKLHHLGTDVFICTDEYNLLLEMSMCLFYLKKLGVDTLADIKVSNDLVSRYLTPSGNSFLMMLSKTLPSDTELKYTTLVQTCKTVLQDISDVLLDDIVAGALGAVKSDNDGVDIMDFLSAFITNKYKQVCRYARINGLTEPEIPADDAIQSELKFLSRYFVKSVAETINPVISSEEIDTLLGEK